MTLYTLEPLNDTVASFYGKAKVEIDGDNKTLLSYDTKVAYVKDGNAHINGNYSTTTFRHIREFLAQEGFKVGTKKELLKMYGKLGG